MVPNQESKESVVQVPSCFWPKIFDYMGGMSGSIVMMKLPVFPCSNVWPRSSHSITKATLNLQVVLFIECSSTIHFFNNFPECWTAIFHHNLANLLNHLLVSACG